MPGSNDTLVLDMVSLRRYVAGPVRTDGGQILQDAFAGRITGAVELVRFSCALRQNVHTRRSLDDVRREFGRPVSQRGRWFKTLEKDLFAQWRVLRHQCAPRRESVVSSTRVGRLSRRTQQELRPSGLVAPNRQTLAERATVAARFIWDYVHRTQCVIWMDNWCWLRWGTDPVHPSYSQNATVMAILRLDVLTDRTSLPTRTLALPTFPGHMDLPYVVRHVENAVALCVSCTTRLLTAVSGINRMDLDPTWIRVPLDLQRTDMRSLQWRPLTLCELNVSATVDLLELLDSVREVQRHTGRQTPLLVDENIHYRVMRMLYSAPFVRMDVHRYLADVPLLYGVWHAYKHTVTVVYRVYLPVLVHLETVDAAGTAMARSHRRVLYMEKLFASLLLGRGHVLEHLRARLTAYRQHGRSLRIYAIQLLEGLHDLLTFYAPALLQLGYKVRECTWNGRPDGPVKGDTARVLLEQCLVLQVHLQEDWRARTSYVRTIALALATWQPWMSRLPGCVFVEESCEAMNSRLAAACRSNPGVVSFEGVLALYLLLDPPSAAPHHSRGQLRAQLVDDMVGRLRSLIANPSGRRCPQGTDATRFRWVDGSDSTWMARGPLPRRLDEDAFLRIFQTALWTVTAGRAVSTEVRDWLASHLHDRPPEEVSVIEGTLDRIRAWRTGGRRRAAAVPAASSSTTGLGRAQVVVERSSSDDDGEPSAVDEESLYEPPGSDPSTGYVSPGCTDDSDLYTSASSPSAAVTDGDSGLD
jgi:hypothetical protein